MLPACLPDGMWLAIDATTHRAACGSRVLGLDTAEGGKREGGRNKGTWGWLVGRLVREQAGNNTTDWRGGNGVVGSCLFDACLAQTPTQPVLWLTTLSVDPECWACLSGWMEGDGEGRKEGRKEGIRGPRGRYVSLLCNRLAFDCA